jgi:hypothetical protein
MFLTPPRLANLGPSAAVPRACRLVDASELSIAEARSSLEALTKVLAIVVSGVALAGAAFLGVAQLKYHGHYHCYPRSTVGSCDVRYSYWTVGRAWWQIPAAILVAVVGVTAAVALTRRR